MLVQVSWNCKPYARVKIREIERQHQLIHLDDYRADRPGYPRENRQDFTEKRALQGPGLQQQDHAGEGRNDQTQDHPDEQTDDASQRVARERAQEVVDAFQGGRSGISRRLRSG